jgi:hypothetical protein
MNLFDPPLPPPWPVGTRVRYPGPEFAMSDPDTEWVRIGDIGVVVRVREGSAATGRMLGDYLDDKPFHGCSVVRFHGEPRLDRAVSRDQLRGWKIT